VVTVLPRDGSTDWRGETMCVACRLILQSRTLNETLRGCKMRANTRTVILYSICSKELTESASGVLDPGVTLVVEGEAGIPGCWFARS
jgi:hypothetical protein